MNLSIRKTGKFQTFLLLMLSASMVPITGTAQEEKVTITDARHYSHVFGETRNYRIFLPPGYAENQKKRYSVIYFFHGWSQRYFGSSNPYADFDQGDDNGGDNIANFVSDHDVIVVKPDGYNRSPDENYYVRPYNVSPVETYRQFPLYFPELLNHIEGYYRTIPDRNHRAIAGLSMGGFMTFWIGGKYPHLLSAAGSFCGSPEFVVGPRDFSVEYRHRDMYNNYDGMNVRLHYGDKDFIRGYHRDLNRVWSQVMDQYEYKVFDAAHSTCGLGEMFSFFMKSFANPPAAPSNWGHTDVYPEFSVWDYDVITDRTVPGFTVLKNVNARGFQISVREFLPDGGLLPSVSVTVRTPARYGKNQLYTIHDIDVATSTTLRYTLRADDAGRLNIDLTGSTHEVGINKQHDQPNITVAKVEVDGMRWATHGKEVALRVTLLNKGASSAKDLTATLSATRPSAEITKAEISFGDLAAGMVRKAAPALRFRVAIDSIAVERFKLSIRDQEKNEWVEYFVIPLKKNVPEITAIEIADGRTLAVVAAGADTDTLMLGKGNGDGIPNPGESIVILVKDQGKLWRTDVTGADPYVNPFGINIRKSDNWTSFDHVGASANYDVRLISADCPEGHALEFFVEYWLPKYPLHIIKQGVVKMRITGTDTTPPFIASIDVTGDNVVRVKIYDGSNVRAVKARIVNNEDPARSIAMDLTDDGRGGDRAANDHVFSRNIPDQKFGIFHIVLEAEDAFGNKNIWRPEEPFILH